MANSDLLTKIAEYYPHLTKSEKKVADYILSSPQEVLKFTISDLAETCGVGDTTVFRFCRTLKLDGYQNFRLALAISLNSHDVSDIRNGNQGFDSENIDELCRSVMNAYIEAVNNTFKILDFESLKKAVDLVADARLIYFYGLGGSGITAEEAKNKFLRVTPNVFYNCDSHMQLMTASLLSEEDLAIIFSNSGTTKDAIEITRLAKSAGAKTIFITRFPKTPAARYTDVLLISGANEGPMQGGSIAAKTSQLFMVDILYAEYFRRFFDKCSENKKQTSKSIAGKML